MRMVLWRFALLAIATHLSVLTAAEPVGIRTLSVEDAFSTNEFLVNGGPATFSPAGAQLAYVSCDHQRRAAAPRDNVTIFVATLGAAMYTLGCDVWVKSSTDGGAGRSVSGAVGNNWAPSWSPDGTELAFLSDREGAPKLYTWHVRTGEVRKVGDEHVRTIMGSERPQWLPDGRHILVRLRPPGMRDDELFHENSMPLGRAVVAKPENSSATVIVHRSGNESASGGRAAATQSVEELDFKQLPRDLISDIALVSIQTGSTRRLVERAMTTAVLLAPNGRSLVYTGWKPAAEYGSAAWSYELVRVDIASGARQILAPELKMFSDRALSWSPDSKWIAYFSVTSPAQVGSLQVGSGSLSRSDLFIVPASGGQPLRCAPSQNILGFDSDDAQPLWSAQSDAIYATGS